MPRKQTDTAARNSGLTPDERLALLHHHKRQYQALTLAVNEASAEKKRAKKLQKAALAQAVDDCGPEADDEIMLLLQTEGPFGEANLRSDVERRLRVLVWSGVQLQFAFDDLEALATPPNAYGAGKIAGIEGVTAKPPHEPGTEAFEKWMEGWHDGQGVLHSAFEKLEFYEPDMAGEAKAEGQIDLEDLIDAPGADPEPIDTSIRPFGAP